VFVEYTLTKPMEIKIELFNVLGKRIVTIQHQRQLSGTYQIDLNKNKNNYVGQFFYSIIANGKSYSKAVLFGIKN